MGMFGPMLSRVTIIAASAVSIIAPAVSAQEIENNSPDRAKIILSDGDTARIRVGPEHTAGDRRYPRRTVIVGTGVMVEFSETPFVEETRLRVAAPRLSDLIGNPARQAALDRAAKPGDFVTPPAANR